MFMGSLTRLVLRVLAYIAVTAGLIGVEAAEFIVTDPDVSIVANAIMATVAVEGGRFVSKRYGLSEWFNKRFRNAGSD